MMRQDRRIPVDQIVPVGDQGRVVTRRFLGDPHHLPQELARDVPHQLPFGVDEVLRDPHTHRRVRRVLGVPIRRVDIRRVRPLEIGEPGTLPGPTAATHPVQHQRIRVRRRRRVPHLRHLPGRQGRDHRPDRRRVQVERLVQHDHRTGEPTARIALPRHEPDPPTTPQLDRLMPIHPRHPHHQPPEIVELVGKLLDLAELLQRRVGTMRRMGDQIILEQHHPSQLTGGQDLVLPVLAGDDDRHLQRRPRPVTTLPTPHLENMGLPVVQHDPGGRRKINRLPTRRLTPPPGLVLELRPLRACPAGENRAHRSAIPSGHQPTNPARPESDASPETTPPTPSAQPPRSPPTTTPTAPPTPPHGTPAPSTVEQQPSTSSKFARGGGIGRVLARPRPCLPYSVSYRSARHCVRRIATAGRRWTSRARPRRSRCRSR